jgi:hypothetical protein
MSTATQNDAARFPDLYFDGQLNGEYRTGDRMFEPYTQVIRPTASDGRVVSWKIRGLFACLHRHKDGRIFLGAQYWRDEPYFPPKFFTNLEAALVWLKLTT